MTDWPRRCEIGGDTVIYENPDGSRRPVTHPPCTSPVAFLYQEDPLPAGWTNKDFWGARCSEHIKWLAKDRNFKVVPYPG